MQRSQTRSRPPGDAPDEGLSERRSRPGLVVGAAAATALVIVVLNNLGTGTGTVGIPEPDRTELPLPTAVVIVRVPSLLTFTEAAARDRLDGLRLAADVVHRFVPCNPGGVVVEQTPPAGTHVPAGESVAVVVTDPSSEQLTCPDGVATDVDRALANGFYDFSRGAAAFPPPVAPPVGLSYLGGSRTTLLDGRAAQDADGWRVVPPGGGARNAVPLLGPLAASTGDYRVDVGPAVGCAGTRRPPAGVFAGLRRLSITPTAPRRSCADWWALDLFVDGASGRVRGANLDGGGP